VTEKWNHWRENGLGISVFMPLHRNPLDLAGKGIFTSVGLSPVEKREKNGVRWTEGSGMVSYCCTGKRET
jgi:hypothetical protein